MQEDPNPYEAPHAVDGPIPEMQSEATRVNFPGGLKTAVAIGIGGGLVVSFVFHSLNSGVLLTEDFSILAVLAVWVGAFALIGWLLPGSPERRVGRAAIMSVLAFPATVLYVPVCGMVMVASMGPTGDSGSFVLGSVVAFTSVLVLFAVFIRHRARAHSLASMHSTSTGFVAESQGHAIGDQPDDQPDDELQRESQSDE